MGLKDQPATSSGSDGLVQFREDSGKYKFINPLLFIDRKEDPEFTPLKKVIGAKINSEVKDGNATDISVYFRDLNTGRWTGVNEDELYTPSSMLKVIVLMDYLKKIETDQSVLGQKFYLQQKNYDNQFFKPSPIKPGNYTISFLLSAMILNSDNDAADILLKNDTDFEYTYSLFRLPPTDPKKLDDFMSPRSYSVLFRSLYSSTYLSREASNTALELLSHTTFNDGLVAGVPKGTTVSHKFGEHTYDDKNVEELHDCGIIYAKDDPYFLCVMTKGNDVKKLATVIADISNLVYEKKDTD